MADRWYYGNEHSRVGPCSARHLQQLAASGRLLRTDTVWKEDVARGVLAGKVKNLFAPAPADVPLMGTGAPSAGAGSSARRSAGTASPGTLAPAARSDTAPPSSGARLTPLAPGTDRAEVLAAPGEALGKAEAQRSASAAGVLTAVPDTQGEPPPAGPGGLAATLSPAAPLSSHGLPPLSPPPAPGSPPCPRPVTVGITALAVRLACPEDLELVPIGGVPPTAAAPTAPAQPAALPRQEVRPKRRVLGVKGAVVANQDGAVVRYRKKCSKCGHTDTCLTTMPIPQGATRGTFYCPKCRKNQPVEIRGGS